MSRYTVSPSAITDLDEIWFYIARKASIEVAERVVDSISGVFALLAAHPGAGRHRPNLGKASAAFRSTIIGSIIARIGVGASAFFT